MTRQQKWAKAALRVIEGSKSGDTKKLATHCMKGPSLLQQAGAAQALGFWNRNADGQAYLDALAEVWSAGSGERADRQRLVDRVVKEEQLLAYMALTRDLIAAAMWLRRFAQAELKAEDSVD